MPTDPPTYLDSFRLSERIKKPCCKKNIFILKSRISTEQPQHVFLSWREPFYHSKFKESYVNEVLQILFGAVLFMKLVFLMQILI